MTCLETPQSRQDADTAIMTSQSIGGTPRKTTLIGWSFGCMLNRRIRIYEFNQRHNKRNQEA
jgi:hypothetical protein